MPLASNSPRLTLAAPALATGPLAGPTAPIDAEMADAELAGEAEDAAVAAVAAAHRQGRSGSNDMLDVLEAAEAKFDQQHATGAGAGADQQGSPMEQKSSPQGGQPAANTAWLDQHAAPPDTPRKAAISEGTREQMIEAIFTALHANPRCGRWPPALQEAGHALCRPAA